MEKMKKKKWSKPECIRVKLVPEEAVLAHCKTSAGGGPSGLICFGGGGLGCQGQGS
jgi:hypothetical protein